MDESNRQSLSIHIDMFIFKEKHDLYVAAFMRGKKEEVENEKEMHVKVNDEELKEYQTFKLNIEMQYFSPRQEKKKTSRRR